MAGPIIPIGLIMPLLTTVLEIIRIIEESRSIDPQDKEAILKVISDAQARIKSWEEL